MNLGEAITHILKTRGGSLLQDFLKEDLAGVIGGVISDGARLYRDGREGVKNLSLKSLPGDILASAGEVTRLLRVLPKRIIRGISGFQKDMLEELEKLPTKKEKALFCFRVFGILTSSTFATFYNLKKTGKGFSPNPMRLRGAFAQFLLGEVLLRSLRRFLYRLLGELEKELSPGEDLEHVKYFRKILDAGEVSDQGGVVGEDDPAFLITERLKRVILNGNDEE